MENVEVRSYKKQEAGSETKLTHYAPGQKIIVIDSSLLQQYRQQSLATLLSQQLPVFVKSYGFNSMATLNFRGASAAQSQVLWEGIPLQNAASGIADVSLMPVALMDEVKAVYGSSAALLGSGNVGGAILINSKPLDFKNEAYGNASLSLGSYKQLLFAGNGGIRTNKWDIALKFLLQSAYNDFSYKDADGREQKTTNDSLNSQSFLVRAGYKVNDYNTVSLHSWVQFYYRQIPRALFESSSVKQQEDEAYRFLAEWKHDRKAHWYIKTAYLRDVLKYQDSSILLESKAAANHIFAEAGWEKKFSSNQRLFLFIPVQLMFFHGKEDYTQLRTALAGAFNQSFLQKKLELALNGRAEIINEKTILLPGINGSYQLTNWLKLQANVQRTYRYPTLNELYYNPGGNKDLQPEEGWHMDAGYSIKSKAGKKLYIEHSGSAFNRYINNWIIWLGGAIWTPHNLASVHSRGIETENRLTLKTGAFSWLLSANGAYTRATSTQSYIPNDNSIGKQIPYSPEWNGQANAGVAWKGFELSYNHTYTGYRYITTDESQYLKPYNTGNIHASWRLRKPFRQHTLRLDVQCQNISDKQYEVVGFRPMPGRNWLIGLTIAFKGEL